MSDQTTTVSELREIVRRFVDERDWRQFHSPKNLSMSLAIEAAELMEHFQWLTTDASRNLEPGNLAEVGEELADVICYALAIANELDIDVRLLPGMDAISMDDDPSFVPNLQGNSHGTACAALVAARTDNGIGVAGACPECTMRCVRLIPNDMMPVPISADVAAFQKWRSTCMPSA